MTKTPSKLPVNDQLRLMDDFAWRIEHAWNQAKNLHLTMYQTHEIKDSIFKSPQMCRLAQTRQSNLDYLWYHIRRGTLAKHTIFARWYKGKAFTSWCDLPEEIRYNNELMAILPSGFFWLNEDGTISKDRYWVSEEQEQKEDASHFNQVEEPINV